MKKVKLSKRRVLGVQLVQALKLQIAEQAVHTAAKREAKSIKQHFRTDGWDLDLACIKETIFYDAFGFHLSDALLKALLAERVNFILKSTPRGLLLKKGKGRLPKGILKYKFEMERPVKVKKRKGAK